MKRILSILVVLLTTFIYSYGQNVTSSDGLRYSGGKYYYNYNQISQDELSKLVGSEVYSKIKSARGLRTAGIVCTTVGSVAAATGIVLAVLPNNSDDLGDVIKGYAERGPAGYYTLVGGIAVLGSGIAMLCVGNHRLDSIIKTYNLNNGRQISLAPSKSGIGVALRF